MKISHDLAVGFLAKADELHGELTAAAREIRDRANELIKTEDAVHKRKPPCVMAVRSDGKYLGPKLLWVSYTAHQYNVTGRGLTRFTTEVKGRVNGRYKRAILRKYDPELEAKLWQCELDAQALRQQISMWRAIAKDMQAIIKSSSSGDLGE